MKKNLLLRLTLMMALVLTLYSCIHDEVYSSSDSSAEYTNKTLWKQDEKYIKNVMDVYSENEKDIRKISGVPLWDYATTVESFNESFLMVPVVSDNKVVSVLQVPRKGDKVHFYYTNYAAQISFFQDLVFAKHKKAITRENSTAAKSISCTTQTIATWYPADESNPDSESGEGSWGTRTIIICRELLEDCVSIIDEFGQCTGGGGDDPGYLYPGGGGDDPPKLPTRKNPCEKTKAIVNKAQIKDSLVSMKSFAQTSIRTERGFQELKSGTLLSGTVTKNLQVKLGIGPNSLGNIHVHPLKGIAMFSAGDIVTFLHLLREQDATTIGSAYAGMVSASGTYFINFTGTASDIPPTMTEIQEEVYIENLTESYIDKKNLLLKGEGKELNQQLSSTGLEKLFFDLLKKMGLDGKITLLKEENGNTSTIIHNADGTTTPNPC